MADSRGSQSGPYYRAPDVWLHAVNAAHSEKEIVTAARDYVATWTPLEISRLPEPVRPGRITSGEDISEYAFRLSQAHLDFAGALTDRLLVERLMSFFVHAAARIATVASESNPLDELLDRH